MRHQVFVGIGFLFSGICQSVSLLHAQDSGPLLVHVRVESATEPTQAVGLLLSTLGTERIGETSTTKIADKLYDISFSIPRGNLKNDSVATAMAFSPAGDITFGNVTPLLLNDPRAALGAIPECPPEDASQFQSQAQVGPLRSLVEIRAARAELAHIKVGRALSDQMLTKVQKLEQAFGMERAEELSADIAPADLVDRLSRLVFAARQLKMYKGNKATKNSTSSGDERAQDFTSEQPNING